MKKEVSLEVLTHDNLQIDDYLVEMCQAGFFLKEIDLGCHGLGINTLHRSRYGTWIERSSTARCFDGFPRFMNSLDVWAESRDLVSHVLDYAQIFGKKYSGVVYSPRTERVVTSFYGDQIWNPGAPHPMGWLSFRMVEKMKLIEQWNLAGEERDRYSSLLPDYKVAFTPSGHLVKEEEIFGNEVR